MPGRFHRDEGDRPLPRELARTVARRVGFHVELRKPRGYAPSGADNNATNDNNANT
jgi:hypothetical protein